MCLRHEWRLLANNPFLLGDVQTLDRLEALAVTHLIPQHVVRWCAQECSHQESGELSVADMVDAWVFAHSRRFVPLTFDDVVTLGRIVEPEKNKRGLRITPVRVGAQVKDARNIERGLRSLVDAQPPLAGCTEAEAIEFYRIFQELHVFVDGNGRAGALLYNHMMGSLDAPVFAPDLWGAIANPAVAQ